MKKPPVLRHILNLWSLVDYPTEKKPWPLERQLEEAKAAGFDGFTTCATKEHARIARKLDLLVVGFISVSKAADFRRLIQENVDNGAVSINVQLADHDTPVEQSVKLAVRLNETAAKLGAKCSLEVHRDTCTETPEKTFAIAEGYRKATGELLRITWDFSHLSVVKHLAPPYWERLLVAPKLVQHSEQFHFRPFNGHHCQIPVTDGHGRLGVELKQWLPFLDKTLGMWLAGRQDGRELFAVPEMGPVRGGYNLASLPNSWEDAKVLRTVIAKAWTNALSQQKKS
ncbi:MAG: hypothetical protein WC003_10190 [Terrimicrobiaceae bacterium]